MAFKPPTVSDYDPDAQLMATGEFLAECIRATQGIKGQFSNDNVALRFRVHDETDMHFHGKEVSLLCKESIWVSPNGKPTAWLTHCRNMGYHDPERGVDPDHFVGKWFLIEVNVKNGKCFVVTALPSKPPKTVADAMKNSLPLATEEHVPDKKIPF